MNRLKNLAQHIGQMLQILEYATTDCMERLGILRVATLIGLDAISDRFNLLFPVIFENENPDKAKGIFSNEALFQVS